MRRLVILLVIVLLGLVALERWRPGTPAPASTPSATATPLPDDFTLIPTFVPAFPCDLQNVEVRDNQLCRSESIAEQVIATSDEALFIEHSYHMAQGCWGTIHEDTRALDVCQRSSGATTLLTDHFVTSLIAAPSGEWLAFGTLNADSSLRPHLYRVRRDGSGLQLLDTAGLPDFAVGAPGDLRWLDENWLAFSVWDGTGENGWHLYRLKADGSGLYDPLPTSEATEVE